MARAYTARAWAASSRPAAAAISAQLWPCSRACRIACQRQPASVWTTSRLAANAANGSGPSSSSGRPSMNSTVWRWPRWVARFSACRHMSAVDHACQVSHARVNGCAGWLARIVGLPLRWPLQVALHVGDQAAGAIHGAADAIHGGGVVQPPGLAAEPLQHPGQLEMAPLGLLLEQRLGVRPPPVVDRG